MRFTIGLLLFEPFLIHGNEDYRLWTNKEGLEIKAKFERFLKDKVEITRNLLLSAITTDKELNLLSFVVLTLYMGLRPESEVPNLTWKNINLKTGKLFIDDDATGKSDLGRTLVIPKCALNLLKICKKKTGPIIKPTNAHRRDWDTLREMAGFIARNKAGKITKNTWTPDVARHTAGTMVYASTQSKEAVRAFLGHTNDVTRDTILIMVKALMKRPKDFSPLPLPYPIRTKRRLSRHRCKCPTLSSTKPWSCACRISASLHPFESTSNHCL